MSDLIAIVTFKLAIEARNQSQFISLYYKHKILKFKVKIGLFWLLSQFTISEIIQSLLSHFWHNPYLGERATSPTITSPPELAPSKGPPPCHKHSSTTSSARSSDS